MDDFLTNDGSATRYSERYQEHYHSRREGALSESLYKHIIPAIQRAGEGDLKILDICFGLGYNTFATLYYLKKIGFKHSVEIISPELDRELVASLKDFTYPEVFGDFKEAVQEVAERLHYKNKNIDIEVRIGDAKEMVKALGNDSFNIIYQDPFSPKKNPELWSLEFFTELYRIAKKDVVLTTYSSARVVRDNLVAAGFSIEKHIGEGFSKEGTIATKS